MKPNTKIPCVIMRGGTSRALFFHDKDLPKDEKLRDKVILSAFGSPDIRQIDGLGLLRPLARLPLLRRAKDLMQILTISLDRSA